MEESSRSTIAADAGAVPIEQRSILLRGYVETEVLPTPSRRWWTPPTSRFVLFFDTETRSDGAQQLRFGCYQLWEDQSRRERGIFHDPENVTLSWLTVAIK